MLTISNKENTKFKLISEGLWISKDLKDFAGLIDAQSVSLSSKQGHDIILNPGDTLII